MPLRRSLPALLAVGLMLAACAGGDDTATDADVEVAEAVETSPTPSVEEDTGGPAPDDGSSETEEPPAIDDGADALDYGDLPVAPEPEPEPTPEPTPTPEPEPEPEPEPAPEPEPEPEPEPVDAPCDREPTGFSIVGTNFAFSRTALEVCSGDTITLDNEEGTHSFTGGGYDTGLFAQSDPARSITITGGATSFTYVCILHGQMRGTVTVLG